MPPQPGRVRWVLREHSSPSVGLTHQSGSEGTWDKGSLVLPGTGSVLQENKNCPSSPGGSPWLSWQQVLGLANKLSCAGFLHSTRVEDAPGSQSGYGCSPNGSEWWPSRLLGREQRGGDSSFSYFNPSRSIGEGAASQNILVARRAREWYKLLRTLKKRNTLKSMVGLGATMLIFHNEETTDENVKQETEKTCTNEWRTRREENFKRKQDQARSERNKNIFSRWKDLRETEKEIGVQGLGKECASYLIHEEKFSGRKGRTRVEEENEE